MKLQPAAHTPWPVIAARRVAKLDREGNRQDANIACVDALNRMWAEAKRTRKPEETHMELGMLFWNEYAFRMGAAYADPSKIA